MPAVDTLLRFTKLSPKDLDLVGCPSGPGSFTGLRIGMATAKGIARGASCALKTVPSLEFLAAGREHWPGIVVPIIDARKKRVYAAAFKNGERVMADCDVDLRTFLRSLPSSQPILVTGPGACMAKAEENIIVDPMHDTARGRQLINLMLKHYQTEGGDSMDTFPTYLRLSEAERISLTRRDAP